MKILSVLFLLLFMATASVAQTIPAVKGKALDNSEVTLPVPGNQHALILVVGFSHKSGELCKEWGKKIAADYRADQRVGYYVLPVLQSAPSLVRPMILHGMRKDTPRDELSHYVPVLSSESDWKKLVSFSAPDDAYLVVATADGQSIWQGHGPYADETYGQLKKAVAGLLEKSSTPSSKN